MKHNISKIVKVVLCTLAVVIILLNINIKVVKAEDGKLTLSGNNLEEQLITNASNKIITFVENNTNSMFTYDELGIVVSLSNIDELNKTFINIDNIHYLYNTNSLRYKITEINHTEHREFPTAGVIVKENNILSVTDINSGNYLDSNKLVDYIDSVINQDNIVINLEDYYNTECNNQDILIEKVNKVNKSKITYDNGFEIKIDDIIDFVETDGGSIYINENKKSECIDKIKEKLTEMQNSIPNKLDSTREFRTHSGDIVEITGGTIGTIIDIDAEAEWVYSQLSDFNVVENREPIYKLQKQLDQNGTYIEISIKEQHLWRYENGGLESETDIVTGTTDGKHDTPTGVFYISEHLTNRYLRPQGATSSTFVNRWMRITTDGVGLHDATWRSAFGNEIYKTNGSHGCINLPKGYAFDLFDKTSVGDIVVIY